MTKERLAEVETMMGALAQVHVELEKRFADYALDELKMTRQDLLDCIDYVGQMCPEIASIDHLLKHTRYVETTRKMFAIGLAKPVR